jgi:hypothetical protein
MSTPTEWKVIPLCTNDFQTILTRAIANPLATQYHSRTGSVGSARWGVSALEAADTGPRSPRSSRWCVCSMTSSGSIAPRASPWLRRTPYTLNRYLMTSSMSSARARRFSRDLEFQHRIDAGVAGRQRAGYCRQVSWSTRPTVRRQHRVNTRHEYFERLDEIA